MKNIHKFTNKKNWINLNQFDSKLRFLFITLLLYFFTTLLLSPKIAFATPINENTLVELANQERKTQNLSTLKVNPQLYFAAKAKARDMIEKDYFEHYTPDGKSPWDFINWAGYNYVMAGENLAMDFKTAEGAHNAWMASLSHRDNILRKEYEDIAIVTVDGDFNGQQTTIVVEMFGKPLKSKSNIVNDLLIKIRNYLLGF